MERVTISMPDEFAAELAVFMADHHYDNRSEAVRDLARRGLERARLDDGRSGPCVAALSYVFDHHRRDLSRRLTEAHHAHHGLQVATLHVHLDPDSCLEVAVLRGDAGAVRDFARGVIAESGVSYGEISLVPVKRHETGPGPRHPVGAHPHRHLET